MGTNGSARIADHFQELDPIQTSRFFSKIFCLLLLRTVSFTVMECYAIYDESVSAFFSGSDGWVVIVLIWLLKLILSGYTSLSARLGPDKPSNRNRFITLSGMECIVYAGTASNLYHSNQIRLIDLLLMNGSIGMFHTGHVLFFLFNQSIEYHGLYGIVYSLVILTSPRAIIHWSSFNNATSGDILSPAKDDSSNSYHQSSVEIVFSVLVVLVLCCWYSLETHVAVRKRHRFRCRMMEQHHQPDYFYVMLCFAYADLWNVAVKCNYFFVDQQIE